MSERVSELDVLCNGIFFERDRKYMNILDVSMSTLVALYLTDLYHQVPYRERERRCASVMWSSSHHNDR